MKDTSQLSLFKEAAELPDRDDEEEVAGEDAEDWRANVDTWRAYEEADHSCAGCDAKISFDEFDRNRGFCAACFFKSIQPSPEEAEAINAEIAHLNQRVEDQLSLERALQRVSEGATPDERAMCDLALNSVISTGREFTSEDVIAAMGEAYSRIREPRLLGAVIRAAAKANRIINTGKFITGARRHCSPVRVWQVNTNGVNQHGER